uniref:TIL domain-containing protein n=1 Tax=Anopheles stephensi TaxID=30069 RepID=A0A182YHS2_ANOST
MNTDDNGRTYSTTARWYPWFHMIGKDVFGPSMGCPGNETYVQYGRPCGKSCGTYGQICPFVRLNSCVCTRGHVRNENGDCIHYTDCRKTLDDVEFLH